MKRQFTPTMKKRTIERISSMGTKASPSWGEALPPNYRLSSPALPYSFR
jgi:hypothetical protein